MGDLIIQRMMLHSLRLEIIRQSGQFQQMRLDEEGAGAETQRPLSGRVRIDGTDATEQPRDPPADRLLQCLRHKQLQLGRFHQERHRVRITLGLILTLRRKAIDESGHAGIIGQPLFLHVDSYPQLIGRFGGGSDGQWTGANNADAFRLDAFGHG